MLRNLEYSQEAESSQKFWTIIGAGPVGSMQAVLFATIFPGQDVNVLDQRTTHQRNHGLKIKNSTINDITEQLDIIAKKHFKSGFVS